MSNIFNSHRGRTVAKVALASQLFQFIFVPIASAVEQTNAQAAATVSNYVEAQAINSLEAWLNQYGNSRIKTHYDFDAEKFDDSSIDMLFALKDNGSDVTFTQFGFRHYDNRNTLNFGLGYRQLDETYLWGINAFYDRDLTGKNDRVSLGGEYFRDYLRVNANSYFGLTNWHDSDDVWLEGNKTIYLQEKPADGVDIMMNAYLPDYPQLGAKLAYEQYFGEKVNLFGSDDLTSDPYAVTFGLHHTPIPLVTWGVDHKQGKHGSDDTRVYLGLNYRFGETLESQINQDNVNTLRTFKVGRLDLVERNNVITLDYRRKPVIADATTAKIASVIPQTPTLNADGQSTTLIEILVTDANGNILANYPIESITDNKDNTYTGAFVTNSDGKVTVNSLPSTTPGTVTVTATLANGSTGSGEIEFVQSLANASITIAADEPVVVADGTSTTMARGVLADESGNPIANQEIDVEITLEGVTTTTRVTTGPQGEYSVAVPSSSTVGANANITATTVNLPTNISASTSVLYNGDITTKQLTFESNQDFLTANNDNYSNLVVSVTDADGNPIINEEVTIVNKQTNDNYIGRTDSKGKFVYEYSPNDPNNKTRFVPGTDIVFEANFVNDPQEPKTDKLTLSYGRIEANVTSQEEFVGMVGVPAKHIFQLKPLSNALDLTNSQPSVAVDLETKYGLKQGEDYIIEVSTPTETSLNGPFMNFEFIVTITLQDTVNTRTKLDNIAYEDFYKLEVIGLDIPEIDPNIYSLRKVAKEYYFFP